MDNRLKPSFDEVEKALKYFKIPFGIILTSAKYPMSLFQGYRLEISGEKLDYEFYNQIITAWINCGFKYGSIEFLSAKAYIEEIKYYTRERDIIKIICDNARSSFSQLKNLRERGEDFTASVRKPSQFTAKNSALLMSSFSRFQSGPYLIKICQEILSHQRVSTLEDDLVFIEQAMEIYRLSPSEQEHYIEESLSLQNMLNK